MVIDCHAHLVAPETLFAFRSVLLTNAGHIDPPFVLPDEVLAKSAASNVALLDEVGTDVQLLSPRPYQQMQSAKPSKIVHRWIAVNNDTIARTCAMYPDRFYGVAGLPVCAGEPVESSFDELDRAINDLGFVGVSLNPDPYEGKGYTPPLGDPYWYPLYERVVALDVPILVHSSGCENGRESYSEHFLSEEAIATLSLARSRTFDDFPELRVIIPHGAGSVPYQIGRWEAEHRIPGLGGDPNNEPLVTKIRKLWFDTVLHRQASLELLLKVVGPDRVIFGTERPGSGSTLDPDTGRPFDDFKATLENIDFVSDDEREGIWSRNPLEVFPRLAKRLG
jgi:predicted TIM-barrel fold metal-dependent hydrolase